MNKVIQDMLGTLQPKIGCLHEREREIYEAGLKALGCLISDEFFDIPKLPDDKYSTDGLFYSIPYYDDGQLWNSGDQRILLVVYHIKKKSSFCPLRIDFKLVDLKNFAFNVYIQWRERTITKELFSREAGDCFSSYADYSTLKLTDLLEGYSISEG